MSSLLAMGRHAVGETLPTPADDVSLIAPLQVDEHRRPGAVGSLPVELSPREDANRRMLRARDMMELEVVRPAAPCRLLDDWIGPGAYESLRGRSGSICRVLAGGTIGVGDPADVGPSDHPHS